MSESRKARRARRAKPRIRRQESWRYIRVSESWRRPRGKSSRMRIARRGWPPSPAVGRRGRREYRGLHPSGLREVLVHRPEELEGLSPERQAVRVAATVSERKRIMIADQAQRLGLRILNPRRTGAAEAKAEVSAAEAVEAAEQPKVEEASESSEVKRE
jgi:large subunit ribosomal protein L32e